MAHIPRRPSPSRQQSTTPHYQTFPTKPPTSKGKPPRPNVMRSDTTMSISSRNQSPHESLEEHVPSPLPKAQLAVLAIIALAEQTALNSISPYLPDMVATFPGIDAAQTGTYVGLIASSFALAQFGTSYFWGWLSDRIGRKPVVLLGTLFTAINFVAFGFCTNLSQAILVQVLMGLGNGNQAIISTCLGEITDRSNQSKAFTWLPVVYGIGGITGPALGGLLVERSNFGGYPFAPPNLLAAGILAVDFIITSIYLEESLESHKHSPPLGKRVGNLFARLWQFTSVVKTPRFLQHGQNGNSQAALLANDGDDLSDEDEYDDDHEDGESNEDDAHLHLRDVLNRDMLLILITFFIFQFSNISYNSLYPIFAASKPPVGRGLKPSEIGISLAFAGLVTIIFQVGLFGKLRDKIGNKVTYRVGLAGFVVAYGLMPFIAYKHEGDGTGSLGFGKGWLWTELGVVLTIKTVAAVMFLTSALLMITNSASNHSVLGQLNGLAQTLSAAGRAIGPFISGSLFSASTRLSSAKPEALPFGVFGGIALVGVLLSLGIKGGKLETGTEAGEAEDEEEDEEEEIGRRK